MKRHFLTMGLVISATSAQATTKFFEITNRQYGNAANYPGVQTYIDTLFDQIEAEVNSKLPDIEPDAYVKGMAGASKLSTSGVGWDHNTPFNLVAVGGGMALGADLAGNKISDLIGGNLNFNKLPGVAASASATVGFNPGGIVSGPWAWGHIDPHRLRLWANFVSYKFTQSALTADTSSFGFHATYKVLGERSVWARSVKWNGVSVGTGFDHASTKLSISQHIAPDPITENLSIGPASATLTGNFDGTINLKGNQSINTIPFEVSTGGRLFYVLGLYGGLGMDFNFGSSSATADGTSTLTMKDSLNALGNMSGDPLLNLKGSASVPHLDFRGFIGAELEAGIVNVTAQLNKAFNGGQFGATLGAKLFW